MFALIAPLIGGKGREQALCAEEPEKDDLSL